MKTSPTPNRERMNIHQAAAFLAEEEAGQPGRVKVDIRSPFPARPNSDPGSAEVNRWRERLKRATAAREIEFTQFGEATNSPAYYRTTDLLRWWRSRSERRVAINA